MSAGIKAVFFDAAGTLIAVDPSVGEIYADVATRHGLTLNAGDLQKKFAAAFSAAPPLCFPGIDRKILRSAEKSWWRERVVAVIEPRLFSANNFEPFFEDLFETFAHKNAWRVYPDVVPVFEELRSRGFFLGVLSNFDTRLHDILEELGLKHFFKSIVCSTQAPAAKPDPACFHHAFSAYGSPREIAYIGDDFYLDIRPARALGARAFWLRRSGKRVSDEGEESFESLYEILRHVLPRQVD